MKFILLSLVLAVLTVSCSNRAKHAVYDMMHERERQECLKQGRSDCPRTDSYNEYKKQRDDVIKR